MSVENRKRLEQLKTEIMGFLGSSLHTIYVKQVQRDIEAIEDRILNDVLETPGQHTQLFEFRGERRALLSCKTLFEDAVANLDNRVQQMLDEENQTLHKSTENV